MISKDNIQLKQPNSVQVILDSAQIPRKRRSKNQQTGRDFLCECGKSYLSYSALYTHAKVKHGQKITFEQSLYTNSNYSKSNKASFIDTDLIRSLQVQQKQYSLTFLKTFLKGVRAELKDDYPKLANPKKVRINNTVFLQRYKKHWEGRVKDDEEYDGVSYVVTIDEAIGYFLIQAEKTLQTEDFAFIQMFIMRVRNQLNDIKANWRHTQITLVNDFPIQLNQIYAGKFKGPPNEFFKEHPTLVCMLLYHITSWFFAESFTTFRVHLNMSAEDDL